MRVRHSRRLISNLSAIDTLKSVAGHVGHRGRWVVGCQPAAERSGVFLASCRSCEFLTVMFAVGQRRSDSMPLSTHRPARYSTTVDLVANQVVPMCALSTIHFSPVKRPYSISSVVELSPDYACLPRVLAAQCAR